MELNKVFSSENFRFMADGETFKDFAVLNVGVKYDEEKTICARLTMDEMKELRDYIDKILKMYEDKKEVEKNGD